MFKRSPSRTQRPKGFKLKHALQILLLVGVCFWLIYQIKHSHDKKKEYDEKESMAYVRTPTGVENFKLGRKGLPLEQDSRNETFDEKEGEETRGNNEEIKHVEEGQVEDKHGEDEHDEENMSEELEKEEQNNHEEDDHDEENKREELEQEEQNKDDEDEQAELDNKEAAADDEENGGGDDEIDERDLEKVEETDRNDEFIDEEKEREGEVDEEGGDREGEVKEGDKENENSSEDPDLDGGNLNSHEAREEHYKADDASSAVSHDSQTIESGSHKDTFKDRKQYSETEVLPQENQSNNTVYNSEVQQNSRLTLGEHEKSETGNFLAGQSIESKGNQNSTTEREDNTGSNLMPMSLSDNRPVAGNSSLEMNEESSNNSGSKMDAPGLFLQNVTEVMNSTHAQNLAWHDATNGGVSNLQTAELEQPNNSTSISDGKQSNSTVPIEIENADATASNSNDHIILSERAAGSDISSGSSSTTNESPGANQNEKLGPNNQPGGIDERSGSSVINGTMGNFQHDAIDSSDSSLAQDINEVRLDLDSLPDSRTAGKNIEDVAAE